MAARGDSAPTEGGEGRGTLWRLPHSSLGLMWVRDLGHHCTKSLALALGPKSLLTWSWIPAAEGELIPNKPNGDKDECVYYTTQVEYASSKFNLPSNKITQGNNIYE